MCQKSPSTPAKRRPISKASALEMHHANTVRRLSSSARMRTRWRTHACRRRRHSRRGWPRCATGRQSSGTSTSSASRNCNRGTAGWMGREPWVGAWPRGQRSSSPSTSRFRNFSAPSLISARPRTLRSRVDRNSPRHGRESRTPPRAGTGPRRPGPFSEEDSLCADGRSACGRCPAVQNVVFFAPKPIARQRR